MLAEWANAAAALTQTIQNNSLLVLEGIAVLMVIHLINWALNYRLAILGIYPRHLSGLPGIIFSPFIHGSFNHLFFNSIPLFLLSSLLLANGTHFFYELTWRLTVTCGALVWIFGRRGLHIGASGVIMAYFGYVLMQAYTNKSIEAILVAALGLYYCGGLFSSLLPKEVKTSWEGHVMGFAAGIFWAFYF